MKIALIAEGSYPYVQGGVSSWINQIVSGMEEHEFVILSIMPSKKEKYEYKYDIPENVSEIKTYYLDSYTCMNPHSSPAEPFFTNEEKEQVKKFFRFEKDTNWTTALKALGKKTKSGGVCSFFTSRFFWDVLREYYNEKFSQEEFNRFF